MTRALFTSLLALGLAGCASLPDAAPPAAASDPVTVRIVGINDFHGNLEPLSRPARLPGGDGSEVQVPVAGAAWLASAIAELRAQDEYSMVISAGDLISASPLISSMFLDEPTIGVMNRIGIDFNAVGNHEFDRGREELLRMQDGGCEQHTLRTPCQVETPFAGADFAFLAANVVKEDGDTLFPAAGIRRFGEGTGEVAVGVIGLTLKDTPSLVTPSGIVGLTFTDEAEAINAAIPALLEQGADALVVAIHQGLYTEAGFNDKSCGGISGPLLDILPLLDPRVDLVISGHTHWAYVCDYGAIDPRRQFLVASAGYGGSFVTDIALTIDPRAGEVVAIDADNVVVQNEGVAGQAGPVPPTDAFRAFRADPQMAAYVALYAEAAAEFSQRRVGRISGAAPEPGRATDETALGNLIADAQLAATSDAGAQIALMNNSGVRTDLIPSPDGSVTFGQIYAVQPFGNVLVTMSYSGSQLLALLEQQLDDDGFHQTFSVSQGFAFAYDLSRPEGQRIVAASLDGAPIDPQASYRVTMNSFLAAGGDNFTLFEEGTDAVTGPNDLDAMEAWLKAVPVRQLPATGRVRELTPAP